MKTKILFGILMFVSVTSTVLAQQSPPLTLQRVVETYVENNLELQAARYQLERTKADQIGRASCRERV